MPISGLLLTLSKDPALQREAVTRLQGRAEFELAKLVDHWLPVALDTSDDARSRELHDWLLATPGVEYVDVVYVNFEESPGVEPMVDARTDTQSTFTQN